MFSDAQLMKICEIAQLFVLLPMIVILFRYQRFDKIFRILMMLIITSTVISYIAYLFYAEGKNNMPLSHLYTLIEYLFWATLYYHLFQKQMTKKIVIGLSIIFTLFSITNVIYLQSPFIYNSYSRSLEALILLCFAISWFYKIFIERNIQKLETYPIFWINAGVLVYFSGSFLLFVFNNFMDEFVRRQVLEAWALHGMFLGFHYLLISIGIWLKTDRKVLH